MSVTAVPAVEGHVARGFEAVRADLIQNVHNMIGAEHASQQAPSEAAAPTELTGFRRYEVNLLVGAEKVDGAPPGFAGRRTRTSTPSRRRQALRQPGRCRCRSRCRYAS